MSITIHSPATRSTIQWASGTSTEMFIYPSDGSFADRSFQFRISSATVEAEESAFTFFEGITRHLMILKGELELIHENRYTKFMKCFDQDTFSGEWSTRSKGRVTDFNLMLKGGAKGSLMHRSIGPLNTAEFQADSDFNFVYLASGSLIFKNGIEVKSGDLVQIDPVEVARMDGYAHVVEIRVNLNRGPGK